MHSQVLKIQQSKEKINEEKMRKIDKMEQIEKVLNQKAYEK